MIFSRQFRILRHRLRSIFHRDQLEADLEKELAFHLDQLTAENVAAGMSEENARQAAVRMRATNR